MKVNLHIADAKKVFTEQDCKSIHSGISRAKAYAATKLQIVEDIDIIVTPELPDFLIPEDKLGARTYTGNFILASFTPKYVIEDLVYEVTCHEMCHAARWQKNPADMKNLFDGMILEGLAIVFEEQSVKNQSIKQFFLQTMLQRTNQENAKILKLLKNELDNEYYDYFSIFITGNKKKDIPRWAGYSVGYYLVKKYLSQTNKTIEEVFTEPFDNFRIVLD